MTSRLRVGLVGTGHFARARILPPLRATDELDVTAVCGTSHQRAAEFASQCGINNAYGDLASMLASDLDVVVIGTPPLTHASLARAAIAAKKHVMCTKPLATALVDARGLADAAAAAGLSTAMDFENRYLPVRRHLRDLVRGGYLGDVRCVTATVFSSIGTDPTHPLYYWDWKGQRSKSGGIMGASLLLHHIDLLRYTFGDVDDVVGRTATFITHKPVRAAGHGPPDPHTPTLDVRLVDAEDTAMLHGSFARGGVFTMAGSWAVHHGSGVRVEAYGSEGTLVLDTDRTLRGGRRTDPGLAPMPTPATYGTATDHIALFRLLLRDFVASIRGETGDGSLATFADGARLSEIATAVLAR